MSYDLLVCDLDGTLIDDSLIIDPLLAAALRLASERGLEISIATGRMPAAAERYAAEIALRLPAIYYNGALIRDPASGQDLLAQVLPRGCLWAAHEVFRHAPVHPLFYRDDRLHCLGVTPVIRAYCEEEALRASVIPDPEQFLRLGGFAKALFIGGNDVLSIVRSALQEVIGDGAKLVRTRSDYLELVPAAASKGAALCRLAAHLGVSLERVIAIGDQENDLEMIETAGLGVAMPHAPAHVRAVADRIAPSPAEGGLLALLGELLPEHFAAARAARQP